MNHVFADTSFWIALLNPRDELHEKAVTVSKIHSSDRQGQSQPADCRMVFADLLILRQDTPNESCLNPFLNGAILKVKVKM
jgi:predicted nucleic acid-binding protein